MDEWVKNQREYLQEQAPLRAKWLDESLPEDEREEAHRQLHQVVEKYTKLCPPITGTFYYTQADVEEAKRAGFSDD
mgnify:CR=1 FL=1